MTIAAIALVLVLWTAAGFVLAWLFGQMVSRPRTVRQPDSKSISVR